MQEKLYRSRINKVFGGVCAGLGKYLDIDPIIIRILFIVMFIFHGIGLLIYIIMWILTPEEPVENLYAPPTSGEDDLFVENPEAPQTENIKSGKNNGKMIFGIILIVLGLIFLAEKFFPFFDFDLFMPILLIVIGIAILINSKKQK